ncbi:unnamed protein product [Rhizopus stolonifer]
MGQTSSKENHLFGYTTPPIESDNDFRCLHDDKQIVDEEIRLKDVKIDRRQQMMDLSKRNIFTITPNISILTMIKRLDLSNNHLNELPDAIGCLRQLEYLSVSDNNLSSLPDTICHLSRLKDLDLSRNKLQSITPYIGHLTRLQSLLLSHNKIDQLPFTFDGLTSLMLLDLSNNSISILPAQIIQLPYLRRIRLENCPLATSIDTFDVRHNPPSLLEICARTIVSSPSIKENVQFTDTLENYLSSYNICSHCHGPYFDSYVSRGRWLERNDHLIPLEYRLCSAHWSDEVDRVFATFSSSPSIQLPPPPQGRLKPNLIGQKNKTRTFYKKFVVQESTKEPSKVFSKMKKWRHKLKQT